MATTTLGNKPTGSVVKINENGKAVEFYVAKHDYESGLNGDRRTLVVRKDCYDNRKWHTSDVNAYATSDIDSWLNGIYKNLLDPDILEVIGTTKFYYTPGNGKTYKTTLSRSIFLLSFTELGKSYNNTNEEGTALPIAKTLEVAYLNGAKNSQWTRTPRADYTVNTWKLDSNGSISAQGCSYSNGSRPAFTLPANLYVSDEGYVMQNTAPATPASISIPSSISGGTSITVQWGASIDTEENLEGYIVERSVNGGSSWSQIYKGSDTQTTNTVEFGTESVMYRVKAYDSEGLQSGYKTSNQATVINNTAPTITCDQASDTDLGEKSSGFSISYTVNDVDEDSVTVTERMDTNTKRTFQPALGQANQFQVTGTYFQQILNGKHTMKINAQDSRGKSAEHILTFTKSVTSCSITMEQPMEADARITIMVMAVTGDIPADAEYQVLVTNNAKDDEPVWEDATSAIKYGANYLFINETAINGFAFNFKLIASRGPSGIGGYISSIRGGFQ